VGQSCCGRDKAERFAQLALRFAGRRRTERHDVRKIKAVICAIFSFARFEELVLSNPAHGWRLKGMMSDYEPIIVPPSDTMRIIDH
jgi:hypothetical protein